MWQVAQNTALHIHSWENEFVIYNSTTGDTHLIGMVAAQSVIKLQQAPSDSDDLLKDIAQFLQIPPDDELKQLIDNTLTDLSGLGIIENTSL